MVTSQSVSHVSRFILIVPQLVLECSVLLPLSLVCVRLVPAVLPSWSSSPHYPSVYLVLSLPLSVVGLSVYLPHVS